MDWILILPRNTAPQRNSLKLLNGKSSHIISTTIMHNNATWAVAVYFWNHHAGQDESWHVIVYQSTLEDSPGHTSPGSQVTPPGSSSKHPAFCASHMATASRPGLYIEHLYKCVARPWEPREPLLEAKGMNHDAETFKYCQLDLHVAGQDMSRSLLLMLLAPALMERTTSRQHP